MQLSKIWRYLGPGLLFASMAIGTSHLVLSTKAGAQYGWIMIVPIILANVLKYPFFEFGVRYTHATHKSLIRGYMDMGKKYLWIYGLVTIVTIFTLLAALYIVTAGLLVNLFKLESIGIDLAALILFVVISALLIIGRYKLLENSLKVVIGMLFIALLITTASVLLKGNAADHSALVRPPLFNEAGTLFLISLIGWMPTAVEASGWVSLWSLEKMDSLKAKSTFKMSLQEFNMGYIITAVLAIFFMIIGWKTMYGTGTELSGNAVVFADQVVNLFTVHIGQWAYYLIALAALATMFSTCMTAHDAIARVSLDIIGKAWSIENSVTRGHWFSIGILVLAVINFGIILLLKSNMGDLVALATFVSFVMAPIVGWMNLKVVVGPDMPKQHLPNKVMILLAYLGIIFLSAFAAYYCWLLWSGS